MKKKFLLMMMLSLLFTAMGTSVLNAQVAKVGDNEYTKIDEAIANWTNGTTLTLLANVTLSDVITIKSTEHHILNLGTYTMTAASGKHAIEITCEGRTSASYAITVNADETDPGGITATGKSCIYYSKSDSTKDRPIILINNGVFNGTYSIYSKSNGNTNCPQIWIYGGTFYGNVNLTKNMLRVFGGVFHGQVSCTGDSSAYREIAGGRFKSWGFMTADADTKFWVGTSKANYNVGVYVDDEGYLVVGGPVITELSPKYQAKASNYSKWSSYLKYSSAAAANCLYYTNAEKAIAKHGAANVTVYEHAEVVEELDNNAAVNDYTPVLPSEVVTFEVEVIDIEATTEATTKVTFNVEPKDASGQKVSNPSAAITFRLPVPAAWSSKANVYHEGTLLGAYTINEENDAKFVEVASANFSEFAVEAIVPLESYVQLPAGMDASNYETLFGTNTVTDGTNYYATLQAAVEAVAGQANAVLYCNPGADVGSLQHAPVVSTLTVYGNGANVTGGSERDFDLGNTDPSGGNDITADMTLTVKYLNGCGAWGAKATEHTVNLVFENCANMGKVFITGTTGTLNITMTDCAFEGVIKEAVYSNADGTIILNNVAFSNLNKAINLNHKAAGTQTVTINDCSFTNCGADVAADQIPVRVLSSVEGGKSVLNVANTTFSGTPTGGADILLDYGVGKTTASVTATAANVFVEKENNVATQTAVTADQNNVEFTNALPEATLNGQEYATLAEAAAAAQAGDEIKLLANIEGDITVPANVTLNGNGFAISGGIFAEGDITFAGVTTAADFDAKVANTAVNIPAGASLQLTGSARLVIGHGATFNITGTIEDAKTADKATLVPSLKIAAGASITGNGVTFNVNNAYIVAEKYCSSKNSNANGTFNFNINNSIWDQTGSLQFSAPTNSMDPTVNFNLANSVLTTTSHVIFSVTKGEVVIDNSKVNEGVYRQLENRSTMTVKNGSVVNGAVATSENAKNPGTIIVENATYAVTGEFSGSDLGTGTIVYKKGATISAGSITKANIQIDATGMAIGDVINFTADLSKFTGTLSVINNDNLEAEIIDGKISLVEKPVAKIGETKYATLQAAFKAATSGCTIEILSNVTIDEAWDNLYTGTKFTVPVTINGNDNKLTFKGTVSDGGNYHSVFRFQADATVKNLTIDLANATANNNRVRAISSSANLVVEKCSFIGNNNVNNARAIIFGEGAGANVGNLEISITDSEFINWTRGITDNENAQDVKTVTITGNTLTSSAVYVSAKETVTFTGNTVSGAYVNIRSYSDENNLSVIATGNTLEENTVNNYNYIYAKNIEAQEEFTTENPPVKVSTKAELDAAINAAKDGDVIEMTADIDYGTSQLAIAKAITLDLGGKTLTTRNAYGGMSIKNNPTIKNGNIVHASNTAAIKVWNATAFEDIVIDVQGKGDANKTIGGIVLQSGTETRVGSIKNVTIKGDALTNGIETYNCGDAEEDVIGSMENVNIDAVGTAMLISAPCGTATNCTFDGGVNGIEIWIKGNYSASLGLVDCDVVGGVFAHDEFSSNPEIVNNGTLNLTADEVTTGAGVDDVTLTLARVEAENVEGVLEVVLEQAEAKVNNTYYQTLAKAVEAAQDGEEIDLLKNVELTSTLLLTKNNILDGNGFKLTPAGGFKPDGNGAVIVLAANMSGYEANRTYTVKNLTIERFSTPSRIVRANFCDATIQNCIFDKNNSASIITSAYAVLNVEDNTFKNNTATGYAVINVGSDVNDGTNLKAEIKGNKFYNNEAATAGIYLASSANVTGNHFKDNTHTGDNANAAAILAGPYTGNRAYTVNINSNAFENAMSKGGTALPSVFAEDWSANYGSTTSFDLSLNYWDGNEPVAGTAYKTSGDNPQVTVKSYYTTYTDGTLGGLEELPQGNQPIAYVKEVDGYVRVWGETWGNAKESYALELYSGETKIATTVLNNVGGIINGSVNVTWNFFYPESTDEYWTTTWHEEPHADKQPDKVVLVIDGVAVNEGPVYMSGADGINPVVWADLGGVISGGTWGGIDWTLVDGTLTITPTTGTPELNPNINDGTTRYAIGAWREAVIYNNGIAEAIGGHPYDRSKVKTLIIKEGVISIGSFTAQSFTNLTGEVVIPYTVNYIGQEAFQKSTMTTLTFAPAPEGYDEELCIAQGAFKNLIIEEVSLPADRPVHLHAWVFNNCHNLKNVIIPTTVVSFHGTNHIDYFEDFNQHSNPTWTHSSEIFAYNENMETVEFGSEEVMDQFYSYNNGTDRDYLKANVGLVTYCDVDDAIDAAKSGGTITLVKNTNAGGDNKLNIPADANITIDLKGKNMTCSILAPNANLTVKNGTITNNDASVSAIEINKGTLTIENVNVNSARHALRIDGEVTATINGGTYKAAQGSGTGTYHAANISGAANVTIEDGTFVGPKGTSADSGSAINVKSGAKVTIEGGDFSGGKNATLGVSGTMIVKGGTFDQVVEEKYLADGFICEQNADGTYGVVKGLAGEGTEENPYLIKSLTDLTFFRDAVNAGNKYAGKYIKLNSDIDLAPTRSGSNWTPIGNSTTAFQGTFDGGNNTISNLVIDGGSNSNIGFFSMTTDGEIKNVIFENAKVSGRLNVGVVAGTPYTSKYTNITVTGHVEVNGMAYVGGVGGKDAYANWTDITVDVDGTSYVKANSVENGTAYRTYVGGVIGFNGEGGHTFKNITSNIKVKGSTCDIGGIFGIAHYGNKVENVSCSAIVESTGEADELGGIAGVWHNEKGTSVTMNNVTFTGKVYDVHGEVEGVDIVGGAYNANNETASTSGSLVINGETVYPYVAKIGEVGYNTLAKAVTAAQDGKTIQLLWVEGDTPIAMNASLYGKSVTITGTATVDWSKGNLFVGRGGEGNATLTFDGANLTSASNSSSYGIHVSGREKNTNNKYDGTLVIKNSTIELDYLIDRGTITLDEGANLTVENGFGIAGRPASETESGENATATISLKNGAKLIVNNHNGMGVGQAASVLEGYGIMNIDATSTFETKRSFTVTAKGTMNVDGGNVKVVGTLTNNGAVNVTGESILDIETLTENEIYFLDGAIIKNSTIGGEVFVAGKVTFHGNNTFAMLYDFGTLTDEYGTTANMEWTVEEGASLTLTKMARYGLGYGDNVTINGSITNALEARENLTEDDRSLFMHGLVAQESSGFNCNSKLTVKDAYVVLGSNNSFGNKPGNSGGNYTFNFNNSVVDGSRITFYEASSITEFTFEDSDVKIGTFMTRDTDSKFTLKNSKVLSTEINNGDDEGNYNAGELTLLDKSSLTYRAAFTNTGTLNLDLSSKLTAPSVAGNGTINIDATDFEGNEICVISANMASFEGVINVEGAHYMKKDNGIYVTGAQGTLTKAYTSATGYWGECGGNANESFVFKFFNDDTYMGQTSLNDIDNIIDGDVYVTWSIDLNIDPNTEGYWAMSWDIRPTLAMQPNRVEQWIDGEKVAECAVEPNWADNIFPVVAAVTDENDVILSYVNNTTGATLNDAFAAGGNIAILRDFNLAESVTVPADKTVVLNLNGYTISQEKACTASYQMIENKGALTIKDSTEGANGKISFKDTSAGDPTFGWGSYTVRNEGTLVVENGTIEHLGAQNQQSNVVHMYCAIFQYSGSSTINDGTISTPTYRSVRLWKDDMTINGGTFEGQVWVQCVDDSAELTINGGNFSPRGGDGSSVFVGNVTNAGVHYPAGFTVTGGTFETKIGCNDAENLTGDRIIGGLFSQSAVENTNADLLGDGFEFVGTADANGYYSVIKTSGTFTRTLSSGWSWFSYYIDIEGANGLDALKEDMGAACEQFKSHTAFTFYSNNKWYTGPNALTGTNVEDMYMVKMRESREISLSGKLAVPEEEMITLNANGWTWIGYPLENSINVSDALATFNSIEGDYIKSKTLYAEYVKLSDGTYAWKGSLNSMIPGEGYKYKSVSGDEKEVYYSSASNRTAVKANVTSENNYWVASNSKYSSNMTVVAMMSIDNEIVNDSYEIAAFANGECRGSARAIYDEDLNAYMLYLTIHGEDVENITFKYYDVNYGTEYELGNVVVYSSDAILGSINNPYMFNLDILNVDEASINEVNVYPNPTTTNAEIDLNATCDKVEVFNALGVKVAEYSNVDSIDALETAGVYVIRVTIDGNVRNCRLVVK